MCSKIVDVEIHYNTIHIATPQGQCHWNGPMLIHAWVDFASLRSTSLYSLFFLQVGIIVSATLPPNPLKHYSSGSVTSAAPPTLITSDISSLVLSPCSPGS